MFTSSKKQGFSLIEVMVALLLISLTMLIFGYFAKSLKITSSSRQETQAITGLRSSLDKLRGEWGVITNFNQAVLPMVVDTPQGYTSLTVTVTPLSVGTLAFSCVYILDTSTSKNKFINGCAPPTTEDLDSLIRSVNFTLEREQKEP